MKRFEWNWPHLLKTDGYGVTFDLWFENGNFWCSFELCIARRRAFLD